MCLAMNPDKLTVGERCAQVQVTGISKGDKVAVDAHTLFPLRVAAATAIAGYFATPEDLL